MDAQQIWDSIPHGKNDPPVLLYDPGQPVHYDFNEPDPQEAMFNPALMGSVRLPFTKPMEPDGGYALIDGLPAACSVETLKLMGQQTWWLALKPGGRLCEYGKISTVQISGFRDKDGNVMVPAEFQIATPSKVDPDPADWEREKIALQAAQDGIVLMKNDNGALPLAPGGLNLCGTGAFVFRMSAVGAGKTYPRYSVGLVEAARKETEYPLNEELLACFAGGKDVTPDQETLAHARSCSRTAVMVISRASGENMDNSTQKGEHRLSDDEEGLLHILRAGFDKLVVVLNVGYPIDLAFVDICGVDALVYCGFGGMFGGQALMDVLTGRVNPSGRLPDTWAQTYDSIPASRNFYDCGTAGARIGADDGEVWIDTVYEEDLYVGYRYFETFPNADRRGYPFGHGLSYTTFERQCLSCEYAGGNLTVHVEVRNTGPVPGREVVQLYLSKPQGVLEQPARELIGLGKTALLEPGQSQHIAITVPDSRMTSFDPEQSAYVLVPGEYGVYLGGSVRDAGRVGAFRKASMEIVRKAPHRMQPGVPINVLTQRAGNWPEGCCSGVKPNARGIEPKRKHLEQFDHPILPRTGRTLTFKDVMADESLLPEFVGNLNVETLARVSVCASDGWGMEGRGEAGWLFRPDGLELPEFVVADGNSGVNLRTRNIGVPSGATLCASFDPKLMEQVGRAIGEEAKSLGIHLILAPGMNLHRNPLNGRQAEYFSEDPYLAGTMAGWYCKGLESTGVGGCYKHFIANNAESSRKRNQSIISERAIRELYFKAFEYALEEHRPVSIMTAYNAVNGVFTSCDPELLQGLLFQECEFNGFVMTDWCSYDSADVVDMARAGMCWITPGSKDTAFTAPLVAAVQDGRLPLGQLQENVLRLLRVLVKLNRKAIAPKSGVGGHE